MNFNERNVKMKSIVFAFGGAFAVFLSSSCCCSVETQDSEIACGAETVTEIVERGSIMDTVFTLELSSLKDVKNPAEKPPEAITLSFSALEKADAGKVRVSGCSGVNRYFGTATIDGDKIKFSPLGSTMMAGPGMNYESTYLKTIDKAVSYKLAGGVLELMDKSGKVILKYK